MSEEGKLAQIHLEPRRGVGHDLGQKLRGLAQGIIGNVMENLVPQTVSFPLQRVDGGEKTGSLLYMPCFRIEFKVVLATMYESSGLVRSIVSLETSWIRFRIKK